jgi:DNA-directed RNA polymerase subunit F
MVNPKIISEKPATMAEVKEEIAKIKERDKELNFRGQRTEEYLNVFAKVDFKKSEEIKKKLEGLKIPRLGEEHIVKIIDILPKTADELKIVLQGYPLTITKESMKKIVDTVNSLL